MTDKKKKTTVKKKTAAKKSSKGKTAATGSAVKKSSKKTKVESAKSVNPLYILTIMSLLVVLIFLINKVYFSDKKISDKRKQIVAAEDLIKSKKIKDEKKNSDKENKPQNIDKTAVKVDARVYFIRFDDRTEKSMLYSVKRKVDKIKMVEGVMKELIKGLTPKEIRGGFFSAVPRDLKIRSINVKSGVAVIDFDNSIQKGAAGNILINRIDQIIYTATQFKNIHSVQIKIDGKIRNSLGGDGLYINGPLKRKR